MEHREKARLHRSPSPCREHRRDYRSSSPHWEHRRENRNPSPRREHRRENRSRSPRRKYRREYRSPNPRRERGREDRSLSPRREHVREDARYGRERARGGISPPRTREGEGNGRYDRQSRYHLSSLRERSRDRNGVSKESLPSRRGSAPSKAVNMESDRSLDPKAATSLENGIEGDEEQRMKDLLGFGGFDSTKGKHVSGADMSGTNIKKIRTYRQYMNRRGGFNRALDAVP